MRKGLQFSCILIILLIAVSVLPASAQWNYSNMYYVPSPFYKADLVPGEYHGPSWPYHSIIRGNDDGTLTFFVKNQGLIDSLPCYAKISLSTYVYYRRIPALTPGQRVELERITPPFNWIYYEFGIFVDCFNRVDEINESNNEETGYILY